MQNTFIPVQPVVEEAPNVAFTLGRTKLTKGQVGIEIEAEGQRFYKADWDGQPDGVKISSFWKYKKDGSLRGMDNAEYVLAAPIMFDEVPKALEQLWDIFEKNKTVIEASNRTSVHVHLNVQDFYLPRLTSLMAIYLTFEEVLTDWCGEHRVGNLFCLRAVDAPAIVTQLRAFVKAGLKGVAIHDHHHYAGMNVNAIHTQGSIEFRTLQGTSDPNVIQSWVNILRTLYDVSETFTDPKQIMMQFSRLGPAEFFNQILGDQADVVRQGVSMSYDEITKSMFTGIRFAQDLAYTRDWSLFKCVEYKPDPFGRKPKAPASLVEAHAQHLAALFDQVGISGQGVPFGTVMPDYDEPEPEPGDWLEFHEDGDE